METMIDRDLLESAAKNDGAALRLAVTLGITTTYYSASGEAVAHPQYRSWEKVEHVDHNGNCPFATMRRAICRAAIEMENERKVVGAA